MGRGGGGRSSGSGGEEEDGKKRDEQPSPQGGEKNTSSPPAPSPSALQRMQKVSQQLFQRAEEFAKRSSPLPPFQGREGLHPPGKHPSGGIAQDSSSSAASLRTFQAGRFSNLPGGKDFFTSSSLQGGGRDGSGSSDYVFLSRPHQTALVEQLVLSYMRDAYTPEQIAAVCWQILAEFSGGNFTPVSSVGFFSAQELHRQLHAFLHWSSRASKYLLGDGVSSSFPSSSSSSSPSDCHHHHHKNLYTGLLVRGGLPDNYVGGSSLLFQSLSPTGHDPQGSSSNQRAFLEGAMMLGQSSSRGGEGGRFFLPGGLSWLAPGMVVDPTGHGFMSPFGHGYIINREGDIAAGGGRSTTHTRGGILSGDTQRGSSTSSSYPAFTQSDERKTGSVNMGVLRETELLGIIRGAWETLTGRDEAFMLGGSTNRLNYFESQIGREEALQQAKLQDMRRELELLRFREEEQQRLKGGGPILQRQQPPSIQRQQLEMNIRQLELQIEQQKQQQFTASTSSGKNKEGKNRRKTGGGEDVKDLRRHERT